MKKRILHLASSEKYSGAESVIINIINFLSNEYEFVYVSPKGSIGDVLARKNIHYIPLDKNSISDFKKICKEWKPDVIHAHDFKASIISACSFYKSKKISHIHQNPSWIKRINLYTIAYSLSCLFYNKVILVSPSIFKDFKLKRFFKEKYTVLENIIDLEKVNSLDQSYKVIYDIAFVGRLTEAKDPLRFIELVSKIKQFDNNIRVVMIGDGEMRDECHGLINQLGMQDSIEMLGFLDEPLEILKLSKIFISTSKWEGFGLAAVEALALGKPVFSPPVGGLKDIVTEECGGHYVNDKELIQKVLYTLNNEDHYQLLSRNAKQKSKKYASQKSWVIKLRNIYET